MVRAGESGGRLQKAEKSDGGVSKNGRSIPADCERTATVALPTAACPGFISGELGSNAALDAFSTVY